MKVILMLFTLLFLSSCSEAEGPADGLVQEGERPTVAAVTVTAVSTPTIASVPTVSEPEPATPNPSSTPLPPTAVPETAAATALPQNISFAVIGDYGTTGVGSQEVAALVDGWDPDLLLTVGDNNYPDGAAGTIAGNITGHYGRFIEEKRFFPTLGNHDMTTDFGRPYFDTFELPGNERYYDFVRGDVHFFAVNSDWREVDGIGAGSRQAAWLQETLAASTEAWQIVYFHAPPYVSMEAKEVAAMRWPFAAWGADLVLSGHAHLYERLLIDGIPYVVNGLGGGGIYTFDEQVEPGSQIRFNDDYGALLVEGTAERLVVRFVTRGGMTVDEVVLSGGR